MIYVVSGLDDKQQGKKVKIIPTHINLCLETDPAETDRIKILSGLLLESAREERERDAFALAVAAFVFRANNALLT